MPTARPSRFIPPLLASMMLAGVAHAGDGQASDQLRAGVTIGYPASVGLIFQLTDTIALRPELSFSGSSADASLTTPVQSSTKDEGSTIGVGLSALFYAARWDSLRAYISPRWSFSRASSTITTSIPVIVRLPPQNSVSSTNTSTTNSVAGSLGAEYSLGRRFAVFGETGFGYTRQTTSIAASQFHNENHLRSWGTRTGVGLILRF